MIRLALVLTAIGLAAPASADTSDSGNLTIGGQGIIVGSMTVQGGGGLGATYGITTSSITASSATLSATGASIYSLTTSSGIHVLNGKLKLESGSYITWPDGTTSTTSAGGGGAGNVVLSATQTFTGANTFASSVTISGAIFAGPTSYSSTATLTGTFMNGWNTVSISSFQNVSQVFLYGLASSTTYRGSCALYKKTVGNIYVQLNGDAGGNYHYSGPVCPSNQAGCTHISGSGETGVQLTGYSNPAQNNTPISILFTELSSAFGLPKRAWFHATVGSDDADIRAIARTVSAYYNGSANLSQIRVYASAGTFDGQCVWEQFVKGF